MKNTTIFTGDVFIIPNPVVIPSNENVFSNIDFWSRISNQVNMIKYSDELPSLSTLWFDDKYVECWFATPGNPNSNWYDHGIDHPAFEGTDDEKRNRKWYPAINRLPASLFAGKKEGDVITFTMMVETRPHCEIKQGDDYDGVRLSKSVKVSLTLRQKAYRYRNFGTFEQVLEMITR